MGEASQARSDTQAAAQLDLFREVARANYSAVQAVRSEIDRCLKCGLCRSVCPVFAEILDESGCARGKIALVESLADGELGLSSIFSDRLSKCLNCKSCMEVCPSGIKVDEIVLAARAEIFTRGKFSFVKRFVFRHLLRRGRLLPPISKFVAFIERKILRCLPPSSPYRILLPVVKIDRDRVLPIFAEHTLMDDFGEILKPKGKPRMRVGFFLGCSTNLIYTNIGRAVIRILLGEGFEVVIPRKQGCCGVPVFTSGDRRTGRELALKNIRAFEPFALDAIVTACASCGRALKTDYETILGFRKNALGAKVYDLNEFLAKFAKLKLCDNGQNPIKVTYHDPCHLNRGQGITEEPRKLLEAIPNVSFIEMEEAKRCCGGGGLFSFTHYDIAKEIGRKKAGYIAATGADAVATSCPSCIMQLEDVLRRSGLPQRVVHVAELLAACYPPLEESLEKHCQAKTK
ncbi:MAG TPA: (Fe-S)-binding protein [Firmicutes bacterium]|nr:(Fe-S)-binding protein [Bacillota bacterium]